MLQMYANEKRKIVEDYTRRKEFFIGPLQESMRKPYTYDYEGNIIPRSQPDPIVDRANWSGEEAWFKLLESELANLEKKYEKYLPKPEKKYMWIGINPPDYTMKSLYDDLEELKLDKYTAVVEGHTEHGYRAHIHMIYTGHHKPYRIIDKLSKHFNCQPNFIEAKNLNHYYEEKLEYIKGNKCNEKKEYVQADRAEREKYKIPHFIEK